MKHNKSIVHLSVSEDGSLVFTANGDSHLCLLGCIRAAIAIHKTSGKDIKPLLALVQSLYDTVKEGPN